MPTDKTDLEPLDPSTAQDLFLEHKKTSCASATVQNYRYRMNHFVEWCAENGIDNLNQLSGRDIQRYRLWRQEDGDLNQLTLRMQMSSFRVFLKWAGTVEAVPENLYNKVMIPRVRPDEHQRDETLGSETAQEILNYLSTYEYASINHVILSSLWETGMRLGSLNALDTEDIDLEEERLRLVHRPEAETPLKNGKGGERYVAMSPELCRVVEDYIADRRYEVTDDYGRNPLVTSENGRMAQSTIRRTIYRITAPCYRAEPCEDCKQGEAKCPNAVSPHGIRRGSITHYLSNDVPVEIVSDRMNVSRKVLDKHYDKRSAEVKVEQRRGYLDQI